MTKEEVLQRANTYCSERSYDNETLTDEFKDKFAEFFAKRHESANIDDEGILDEIKFNIDTARSAAAKGIASKQQSFVSKENDYKQQIEELKKKAGGKPQPQQVVIPDEIKQQLDELRNFKQAEATRRMKNDIVAKAKEQIRKDLHKSFETFADDYAFNLEKSVDEQAKQIALRFQAIFKDSIGDIKPLQPRITNADEEQFIESVGKVTIE